MTLRHAFAVCACAMAATDAVHSLPSCAQHRAGGQVCCVSAQHLVSCEQGHLSASPHISPLAVWHACPPLRAACSVAAVHWMQHGAQHCCTTCALAPPVPSARYVARSACHASFASCRPNPLSSPAALRVCAAAARRRMCLPALRYVAPLWCAPRNLLKKPPLGGVCPVTPLPLAPPPPPPLLAASCALVSDLCSASRTGTSSLKDGRAAGFLCQQRAMTSARGAGVLGGGVGRRPCCTTPTAACNHSNQPSAITLVVCASEGNSLPLCKARQPNGFETRPGDHVHRARECATCLMYYCSRRALSQASR